LSLSDPFSLGFVSSSLLGPFQFEGSKIHCEIEEQGALAHKSFSFLKEKVNLTCGDTQNEFLGKHLEVFLWLCWARGQEEAGALGAVWRALHLAMLF
jgi:hypothetical protein